MVDGLARWWDGVELWATGLPFTAQVVLALGVILPLCVGLALVLDTVVVRLVSGRGTRRGAHRRARERRRRVE